jgi:Toprim domain
MMDLRALARALGGDVVTGQVLCPGPGHSTSDRSLSVRPSHQSPLGFITHSFSSDPFRACRDHVAARLGCSVPSPSPPRPSVKPERYLPDNDTARARRRWREGVSPLGTIVEPYLASRSLSLPADEVGDVVRFHPACPWGDEDGNVIRVPAMLTAFRMIDGDALVAVHRTALRSDGTKVGRRMLGPVRGAAIKISADEDVTQGLTIAEGFETGLAAYVLGFRPVWAVGSAGAISDFPVLSGIEALTICAETDHRGANAQAIDRCGSRWADAGREVIVIKSLFGGDMNEALQARGAAAC